MSNYDIYHCKFKIFHTNSRRIICNVTTLHPSSQTVAIIGAGPAGLMAADALSERGLSVDVYDAKPSAGRKFLVAGKGGLNLTHSEPFEAFLSRYSSRGRNLLPMLTAFGADELRRWAHELGFETFIGTSGRVFPEGMKSLPLLRAWLARLHKAGVRFHFRHEWQGWDADQALRIATPDGEVALKPDATVLALGGGSWPKTGSTGAWVDILRQRGVEIAPLKPSNCGFEVDWSAHFRERFAGQPLKSVVLSFVDAEGEFNRQGEFVITEAGLEGSLIYACSARLRDSIEAGGDVTIHLDLAPGWTRQRLADRLSQPRGSRSLSSHLKKTVGISGLKAGLLWEFVPKEDFQDACKLASWVKDLPVTLLSPRPLEEAISSAGGVRFEALDERLMLKSMPGVFCAGEMLDWEAPTGGYLLTACFSTGRWVGEGVVEWYGRNAF
jgi:uncharacterized flavoprotein (TIGR03862 family)